MCRVLETHDLRLILYFFCPFSPQQMIEFSASNKNGKSKKKKNSISLQQAYLLMQFTGLERWCTGKPSLGSSAMFLRTVVGSPISVFVYSYEVFWPRDVESSSQGIKNSILQSTCFQFVQSNGIPRLWRAWHSILSNSFFFFRSHLRENFSMSSQGKARRSEDRYRSFSCSFGLAWLFLSWKMTWTEKIQRDA